jgi:hypothetical protein
MPARLRVLARGKFRRFHGNCANNSGVEFQVTECEHDGRRFFVRENFRYDTFTSNSGVRWGLQQGHTVSGVNILELACKPEHFEELSRIVHEADQLKRPVVRNRKFTLKTARRQIIQGVLKSRSGKPSEIASVVGCHRSKLSHPK